MCAMVTERYKDRDVKGLSGNIREMGEDQPQDPDGLSLAFAKKSSRGHRVGQLRGCLGVSTLWA